MKPDLSNVRLVEPTPKPPAPQPTTLKEQLAAEIADHERKLIFSDPAEGDWHHLTEEEEAVFNIDGDRFPRLLMTFACYETFKGIAHDPTWDDDLIEHARCDYPQWCDRSVYTVGEFQAFAKEFAGLSYREAHAMWFKQAFWNIRAGHTRFTDEPGLATALGASEGST